MISSVPTRERCGVCEQISPVGFWVPNDIWAAVVQPHFVEAIHCLSCFTSRADEKLIEWDRDIKLYPVSNAAHLRDVRGMQLPEGCSADAPARVERSPLRDAAIAAARKFREYHRLHLGKVKRDGTDARDFVAECERKAADNLAMAEVLEAALGPKCEACNGQGWVPRCCGELVRGNGFYEPPECCGNNTEEDCEACDGSGFAGGASQGHLPGVVVPGADGQTAYMASAASGVTPKMGHPVERGGGWRPADRPGGHKATCHTLAPTTARSPGIAVTEGMVNRFLSWKLPQDFAPDCHISFKLPDPVLNPNPTWPVGTNLLTADQARAMLEHVVGRVTGIAPSCVSCGASYVPFNGIWCHPLSRNGCRFEDVTVRLTAACASGVQRPGGDGEI